MFLTARTGDLDKLMGLGNGGDDYITKPFNPLEVVARIRVQLRRQYLNKSSYIRQEEILDFGYFTVRKSAGQLIVNGVDRHCTAKEFELLVFLCEYPNRIFTAQQLYERVWGSAQGDEKTVVIHISKFRKKIEKDPSNPRVLIRGLGYKFVSPCKG